MSCSDISEFPIVLKHEDLRCAHCGGHNMDGHRDDFFAAGRGRYQAKCKDCGQLTWYDLWSDLTRPPDPVADPEEECEP